MDPANQSLQLARQDLRSKPCWWISQRAAVLMRMPGGCQRRPDVCNQCRSAACRCGRITSRWVKSASFRWPSSSTSTAGISTADRRIRSWVSFCQLRSFRTSCEAVFVDSLSSTRLSVSARSPFSKSPATPPVRSNTASSPATQVANTSTAAMRSSVAWVKPLRCFALSTTRVDAVFLSPPDAKEIPLAPAFRSHSMVNRNTRGS